MNLRWDDDDDVDWQPRRVPLHDGIVPVAVDDASEPTEDPDSEVRCSVVQLPDDDLSPFPPLLLKSSKHSRHDVRIIRQKPPHSTCNNVVSDEDVDAQATIDDPNVTGFVDTGKEFLATKAFLGAIYPPSAYVRSGKPIFEAMDETFNNWGAPEVELELDYVFGYRARDSRSNLHWISDKKVVFPVAGVGVIYDMKVKDEDFYFGHTDDIVCLDLHLASSQDGSDRDLVASGSIGANTECQLCIWDPHTLETIQNITGFLQYAVVSVNFNPSATLVCAVGLDEHHSVALFSVASGALLGHCAADKNRILQSKFALSSSVNCDETFVTIGVSHICFWGPSGVANKGQNYFLVCDDPLDKRLSWQRGFGIGDIDHIALMALDFTHSHTIVGGSTGVVYILDTAKKQLVKEVNIKENPTGDDKIYQILVLRKPSCSIGPLDDGNATQAVAVGTQQGLVSFWNATTSGDGMTLTTFEENTKMTRDGSRINFNLADKATNNDKDHMVNSVRSIAWFEPLQCLVVGTILSTVYTIHVPSWRREGQTNPSDRWIRTLIAGHFGNLKDANAYGEVWGVDVHPFEQKAISCGDDSTVRVWNLDTGKEEGRKFVRYLAHKVTTDPTGTFIAVGHRNGGVTVLRSSDLQIVVPFTREERRRSVEDIKFSPNGQLLAIASGQSIYISKIVNTNDELSGTSQFSLERVGICKGHTSFIDLVDWNIHSNLLQSVSRGYDLLYFSIPDCAMVTGAREIADELWFTQSCTIGWGVQGVWPRYADGTDINSVAKSRSQRWLVSTDDWGRVKLFNYPCLGSGFDRKTGRLNVRPQFREYRGHSSHVTNSTWTFDDSYVVTTGGGDLSIFVWKVKYDTVKKPEFFLNAASRHLRHHRKRGLCAGADPSETTGENSSSCGDENAPAEMLPKRCMMCEFEFVDELGSQPATSCPRCYAPRLHQVKVKKLRKAWVPGSTAARFTLPTQSFAKYTREQQQQRRQLSEKQESVRAEVVWKSGSVKVVETVHGASSDEEAIAKKLKGVKKTIIAAEAPSAQSQKPASGTRKKKTSGPDFRDY